VRDQRVRERHPRRTCSDDEVIGLDFPHALQATALCGCSLYLLLVIAHLRRLLGLHLKLLDEG
jgi:hypothetical protein